MRENVKKIKKNQQSVVINERVENVWKDDTPLEINKYLKLESEQQKAYF